ncbi:unnamed protein product [Urochloa decumbens]|uniref:C2H2-type domain-containing protein n=1 Tax=Urochloa decumbens TaxID=240449 RepID=A0ABC9GSC1_9POAL
MGMEDSSSSPPPRRLRPPPDDDLEEGQFVPAASHSSDTDDDEAPAPPPQRARRRLTLEEVLALGRGDDLPSPTPSSESDGTISDDSNLLSPASVFRTQPPSKRAVVAQAALDGAWATTGKRGWAGGKPAPAAAPRAPLILNDQSSASHSNVSSDSGSAHAALVIHQQPPFVAEQAPLLLHLHQPASAQHPWREYTCKECGRSFPTNQALGGHAAGHRNRQREAEAAAAAAGMVPEGEDSAAFLAALRRARGGREEAPHECRKCGKVFATGVALGGHMRVHYTGPPIVPARKNKRRRLALLMPVGDDAGATPPPPPGLSLALSIKTEAEAPSTPAAPAGGVRVVRLFGIDISPQVQQAPSSEQQCFGKAEDFSSAGGQQ